MAFLKHAEVTSLATGSFSGFEAAAITKVAYAGVDTPKSDAQRSYYIDGARKLDVAAMLKEASSKFDISAEPGDYILEAIRANSANVPNQNHDAFRKDELLRFDPKRKMAVYLTYKGKPHHMNHVTHDPKRARGVILDAHYNDTSPAQDNCENCGHETKHATNRDPSGIHCGKCAHVVKDEFVEILVAVDTAKDPTLASGIRSGALNAGSMGCNCASTVCNVCEHVAHNTNEFCEHIRSASKGSLWRVTGAKKYERTDADTVRGYLKQAGYKLPTTLAGGKLVVCSLVVPELNFEVRKAFERCQGVEFEEYSRVGQPADPTALTIELLKAAGVSEDILSHSNSPEKLTIQQETELLLIKARLNEMEKKMSNKTASAQAASSSYYVVRVNGNDEDLYAGKTLQSAIKSAALGKRDRAEYAEVTANSVGGAIAKAAKLAQYLPTESAVNMTVPDGAQVLVQELDAAGNPVPNEMQGQPGAESVTPDQPQSIEDVTQQELSQQKQPGQTTSPEEFGMLPPGASVLPRNQASDEDGEDTDYDMDNLGNEKFASVYGDYEIEVFSDHAEVSEPGAGLVFSVKTASKLAGDSDMYAFGREVMDSLLENGLVRTAQNYKASFSKRLANASEGGHFDLDEIKVSDSGSILDNAESDLDVKKRKSVDSVTKGLEEDIDVKRPIADSAISDRDNDLGQEIEKALSATKGGESDIDKSQKAVSVGKGSTTDGLVVDLDMSRKAHRQEVEKLESNLRKLWAGRLEKAVAEAKTEIEARFARALKIASQRQTLNLEISPLKATLVDSLTVTRPVGKCASTGRELEWRGLETTLALHLVEAAWQQAASEEIDALVKRASDIMGYDDAYLLAAESDLSKQAVYLPQVVSMDEEEESEGRAAMMRQAATNGNFVLAPCSTDDGARNDKTSALREALRNATVGQALNSFSAE